MSKKIERRKTKMAHIEIIGEGKNKKYKVMYELPPLMGERRRKSKTFPAGTPKSVVDAFKRQVEIDLATGEFVNAKEITLDEFTETVYYPIYTKYLSPSTLSNYKKLYKSDKPYCIKKVFGKYKLKDISRRMVQNWVNTLSDNTSPKTVRSYLMFLHSIYNSAITEDIIKPHCNPTEHIKLPPKNTPPIEAYTIEQINKLLELSRDDNISHLIIALGSLSGLRRGELAGLRWENARIDTENPELNIVETRIVVDGKETVKAPKTKAGNRVIPIPNTLAEILRKERLNYKTNKLKFGKDFVDKGYVISKPNGEPYKPDGISIHYERFMYKMESEYGIPYKSLHKLRHTYASLLIDNGTNPKVLQKALGHQDITMSLGTYAHAYFDRYQQDIAKLDEIITLPKTASC